MKATKIIIAGSEGLIGKELVSFFSKKNSIKTICLDIDLGHDLTDEDQVKNLMIDNSEASHLINLFAINDHIEKGRGKSTLFDIELSSLRMYCEVNLVALFSVNRAFARYSKNPQSILNFSSLYGVKSPKPQIYDNSEKHIGYTITKHGVNGLTRHLATHLAPIRVNAIVPGGVEYNQDESFIRKFSEHVPLGRMMKASELCGIVEFLCSNKASYVTGAILPVDGGWTSW
tara:strand:+ start:429 stop:1118 length:690 start_codon:yes stop_codon:yes gene_type:complete